MQGTSPGDGLNLTYHFSRPQRFARWGLFFEHDMSTYKTLVDFRLFNHADMWEACKGFRSVIHKAIYTADVELALFFADTSSSSSTLTRTLKTARASLSRRVLHLLTR